MSKLVIPLKHEKCGYTWNYGGTNPYYATCPYCRNQVSIRKNAIVQTNPQVERPERFVLPSTKGVGGCPKTNG